MHFTNQFDILSYNCLIYLDWFPSKTILRCIFVVEYGWKSSNTTLHTSNQCLCKNSLWKIPQRTAKLEGRYFTWRHIRHQSFALYIDDELYYKNQEDEWNTASKFGLIKKPPSTHHQVNIFSHLDKITTTPICYLS